MSALGQKRKSRTTILMSVKRPKAEVANGGEIAGVVVLANAGRSGVLTPRRQDVRRIEGRFGDVIRNEFQIDPATLTADEAAYLSNFPDADQLRASIAKGRREADDAADGRSAEEGYGPQGVNRVPSRSLINSTGTIINN